MTNALPVYLIERVPGAEGRTVEWTSVCHEKKKIFITHDKYRWTSRHVVTERKQQFLVYLGNHAMPLSSHYTLAAAEKAAAGYAKLFAPKPKAAA